MLEVGKCEIFWYLSIRAGARETWGDGGIFRQDQIFVVPQGADEVYYVEASAYIEYLPGWGGGEPAT